MVYNLLVALAFVNAVRCDDLIDHFVEDIIAAYNMTAPTVIIYNDGVVPDYCRLPWVLCLMDYQEEDFADLVHHLTTLHNNRKQDGIIFTNSPTNRLLVNQLVGELPSMFRSNCPVFMPLEYDMMVKLRLDSNIIFFQEQPQSFRLVDKFAVKGGEPITLVLGNWDISNGIRLQMSMNRWERRTDLEGATLISGLSKHDTKFQRWFQDRPRL